MMVQELSSLGGGLRSPSALFYLNYFHKYLQVGILPLNTTADHDDGQPAPHQLCRLMIKDYDIDVSQLYQSKSSIPYYPEGARWCTSAHLQPLRSPV